MILDFAANTRHAIRHDIFDAATGADLSPLRIVYADDAKGVIRRQAVDDAGEVIVGDDDVTPVMIEEKRAIRIELKPQWRNPIELPKLYADEKGEGRPC